MFMFEIGLGDISHAICMRISSVKLQYHVQNRRWIAFTWAWDISPSPSSRLKIWDLESQKKQTKKHTDQSCTFEVKMFVLKTTLWPRRQNQPSNSNRFYVLVYFCMFWTTKKDKLFGKLPAVPRPKRNIYQRFTDV